MMRLVLSLTFGLVAAAGAVAGDGLAVATRTPGGGSAWPVTLLAQAAQAMPDPKSSDTVMWLLAGIIGLIILMGGVISAIIGALTLIEKIRGTKKVDATTRLSDDGPGRVEFDLHVTGLREDVMELKIMQKEMLTELKGFSGDQYKARGRMHRRLNVLENAMHFWAGKLAGQGDEDAKRLQAIITASAQGEEGES